MVLVGVHHPYELPVQQFAPLAESLGFDYLAHGEHVLFRRPLLNAFVALSVAAGCTQRIRLLSAITLLPLYPAALAAKLAASLDFASDGRFDFGIGIGGEVTAEFDLCGVPLKQRARITDDSLATIARLFGDETPPDGVQPMMLPRPVQRPSPPIWVAGRGNASVRRAARWGDVWFPYLTDAERVATGVRELDEERIAQGRSNPIRTAVSCFVSIQRGTVSAERDARRYVSRLYQIDESRIANYVVGGPPEHVVARIGELVEAGADSVLLLMCASDDEAMQMTRLAGAEVRPALAGLN